jgi:hypothetical protein
MVQLETDGCVYWTIPADKNFEGQQKDGQQLSLLGDSHDRKI